MPGCVDCPTSYTCQKCGSGLALYDGPIETQCVKACPISYTMEENNGVKVCKQEGKWRILWSIIVIVIVIVIVIAIVIVIVCFILEGCFDRKCHACKNGWVKAEYNGKFCHRKCPPGYQRVFGSFCMSKY